FPRPSAAAAPLPSPPRPPPRWGGGTLHLAMASAYLASCAAWTPGPCWGAGAWPNATIAPRQPAAVRNIPFEFIDAPYCQIPLLRRLEPEHRAGLFVGKQIKKSIGSLSHVADALMKINDQRLAALFTFVIEDDPLEVARSPDPADGHRADEQIVFPRREAIAGVERHTGGRNRRHPEDGWQHGIRRRLAFVQRPPVIV